MTELLVKTFVKDYQNTEEAKVRTAYGVLASLVGIVCNLLLFGESWLWTGASQCVR